MALRPQTATQAESIAKVTRNGIRVCILGADEGAGAVVALFNLAGGRGGSDTSESISNGIGASAGGCAGLLMSCSRSPGRGGAMKLGVLFPMFMQVFDLYLRAVAGKSVINPSTPAP